MGPGASIDSCACASSAVLGEHNHTKKNVADFG